MVPHIVQLLDQAFVELFEVPVTPLRLLDLQPYGFLLRVYPGQQFPQLALQLPVRVLVVVVVLVQRAYLLLLRRDEGLQALGLLGLP